MVFRFLILSDEVDDFKREIKIDSEATFQDLYKRPDVFFLHLR